MKLRQAQSLSQAPNLCAWCGVEVEAERREPEPVTREVICASCYQDPASLAESLEQALRLRGFEDYDQNAHPDGSQAARGICSWPGCEERPILDRMTRTSKPRRRAFCLRHANAWLRN